MTRPTTFLQKLFVQKQQEHLRLLRKTKEAQRASLDGSGTVQVYQNFCTKLGRSKIALEQIRAKVNKEFSTN